MTSQLPEGPLWDRSLGEPYDTPDDAQSSEPFDVEEPLVDWQNVAADVNPNPLAAGVAAAMNAPPETVRAAIEGVVASLASGLGIPPALYEGANNYSSIGTAAAAFNNAVRQTGQTLLNRAWQQAGQVMDSVSPASVAEPADNAAAGELADLIAQYNQAMQGTGHQITATPIAIPNPEAHTPEELNRRITFLTGLVFELSQLIVTRMHAFRGMGLLFSQRERVTNACQEMLTALSDIVYTVSPFLTVPSVEPAQANAGGWGEDALTSLQQHDLASDRGWPAPNTVMGQPLTQEERTPAAMPDTVGVERIRGVRANSFILDYVQDVPDAVPDILARMTGFTTDSSGSDYEDDAATDESRLQPYHDWIDNRGYLAHRELFIRFQGSVLTDNTDFCGHALEQFWTNFLAGGTPNRLLHLRWYAEHYDATLGTLAIDVQYGILQYIYFRMEGFNELPEADSPEIAAERRELARWNERLIGTIWAPAAQAVNDFTRMRMQEESITRQMLPPMPVDDVAIPDLAAGGEFAVEYDMGEDPGAADDINVDWMATGNLALSDQLARTDGRCYWVLWAHEIAAFLSTIDGDLMMCRGIPKLQFPSQEAAEQFSSVMTTNTPSLIAVQLRDPWFIIAATTAIEDTAQAGGTYSFSRRVSTLYNLQLVRIVNTTAYWAVEHINGTLFNQPVKPLEFASVDTAKAVLQRLSLLGSRSQRRDVMITTTGAQLDVVINNLGCTGYSDDQFRRPYQNRKTVTYDDKPLRAIDLERGSYLPTDEAPVT